MLGYAGCRGGALASGRWVRTGLVQHAGTGHLQSPALAAASSAAAAPGCRVQVHAPAALPARDLLLLVHTPEYVDAFLAGTLGEQRRAETGLCSAGAGARP